MNCAQYCKIVFNWFNVVIKREYNHLIDVVVVVSESERMSKPSEITLITGGAKGTDAWATRWAWQCGMRVMCILPYNHPITRMNGKGWRLCGVYLRKRKNLRPSFLLDLLRVTHCIFNF